MNSTKHNKGNEMTYSEATIVSAAANGGEVFLNKTTKKALLLLLGQLPSLVAEQLSPTSFPRLITVKFDTVIRFRDMGYMTEKQIEAIEL